MDKYNKLNFLIDTGTDLSVILSTWFREICKDPISVLSAANGTYIITFGTKILNIDLGLIINICADFWLNLVYW